MSNPDQTPAYGVNYRGIAVQLGFLTLALALGGGLAGYLVRGSAGLWGALMGAAVTGLFFATSALAMHLGRAGGPQIQIRNLVISWFVKLVVLFAAFVALDAATSLHSKVFGVTVLAGVLGSLIIEGRAVWSARIGFDLPPSNKQD